MVASPSRATGTFAVCWWQAAPLERRAAKITAIAMVNKVAHIAWAEQPKVPPVLSTCGTPEKGADGEDEKTTRQHPRDEADLPAAARRQVGGVRVAKR